MDGAIKITNNKNNTKEIEHSELSSILTKINKSQLLINGSKSVRYIFST